ncbi:MAG TPA: hypothetical protein VK919_15080, partial [Solirubrobacterales bacterium]|nr:hypothetical protein [Solirubrobacterales bacterium]
ERKLAIRTYALGAATVLALAAGIVAIVLLLGLREDSATNEDVEALNERIGLVQQEAESAVEAQLSEVAGEVETLQQRVSRLADEGTATDRDIQVLEGDLDDLREQLVDLEDEVERTAQAAERAEQQAAESSNQADDDAADANP